MMSRKSQKKKTKGTKPLDNLKSRLKKHELLHNTKFVSHRPGEEKMSEVLMEFVDPYTVHAGTEERWRKLFGVAVIAWNASMFPPAERKRIVDEQINHKVTSMPEEAKEIIYELMGRKDKHFSAYDKVIVDFELTMTNEGPHVTVAYVKQRQRTGQDR